MAHLLLIAHGSRREASNDEVRHLTGRLSERAGGRFENVSCAFLELAKPSIPDAVDACIASGAQEITVLPYFLSAGRHVTEDIPHELAPGRENNPHVKINVLPYVGAGDAMLELMLGIVEPDAGRAS